MQAYRVILHQFSAFGTPLRGDTLFGQLCWAIVERWGEAELVGLLEGYLSGQPFAVISDPMPAGWLPRPVCPSNLWLGDVQLDPSQRKAEKAKAWVPSATSVQPLAKWRADAQAIQWQQAETSMHNSLDRQTGTTGTGGGFAPYQVERLRYCDGDGAPVKLDLCVILDEKRLQRDRFFKALGTIGEFGYGKDASTGTGRFAIDSVADWVVAPVSKANAWLTLGPCAPQGLPWQAEKCWYNPLIRFGRHGSTAALTGQPFKNPVLLADAAALLTPATWSLPLFCGQGIGGGALLSQAIEGTVHQGYAPIVPVALGVA